MTLSEAMRKGAEQRPQAFGGLVLVEEDGVFSTCAIGAVYEAIFGELPPFLGFDAFDHERSLAYEAIEDLHPAMNDAALCPECPADAPNDLEGVVICLNDTHRWTREKIAEWLAGRGL